MRIMILGSGELGKEFAICAQRHGMHVIAVDSYANAPAMQVSDQSVIIDMKNGDKLKEAVKTYYPDYIVPEIEAINTLALKEIMEESKTGLYNSVKIVPSVDAVSLTMNRDAIRDFVVGLNESSIRVSKFEYAEDFDTFIEKIQNFSKKIVVKPCMSSSGKGQSIINLPAGLGEITDSWTNAINNSRGSSTKVIIEEFIDFSYEVTILTVVNRCGTVIALDPIVHYQKDGDYRWSSQNREDYHMDDKCFENVKNQAKEIATKVMGYGEDVTGGLFGVEFFICKNEETNTYYPVFSELSPRPHDTGMVTMISQNLSEFELHLRSAILGIEIKNDDIIYYGGTSATINSDKQEKYTIPYDLIANAYSNYKNIEIRYFGKEEARKNRRMGVVLSPDLKNSIEISRILMEK